MTSAAFNAAAGLLVLASLFGAACLAVVVVFLRERFDQAVANRAFKVEGFLEELKTDAAYAAVCEYPYSASDLLGMLERHDLITGPEIDKLLTGARRRMPDIGEADEPNPHTANGHRPSKSTDEWIPF